MSSIRDVFTAKYIGCKPVRNYKGYYTMKYMFVDLTDRDGIIWVDSFSFKNTSGMKHKRFKAGDVLEMTVTLTCNNGKYTVSRPYNINKVEKGMSQLV